MVTMEDSYGKRRRGNPWICFGFVVCLLIVVVVMSTPVIMKSRTKSDVTTTMNNAKQIFYLMIEFDAEFGDFPSDSTAVDELAGCTGEFSNDYFAQFFAAGYTKSEEIFYAKGGSGIRKRPDNIITPRSELLSAGECGFAYIKNLSTENHAETPLLLAPMYGNGFKFNTDAYDGKGVVLQIDGAVKQLKLDELGNPLRKDGTGLFDAGKKSPWGEKGFDAANLCYAEGTYHFTPTLRGIFSLSDVFLGVIAVGFVSLMIWLIARPRTRVEKEPSISQA